MSLPTLSTSRFSSTRFRGISLFLVAMSFFFLAASPAWSAATTAKPKAATAQKTSTPSRLDRLTANFEDLRKNKEKGGLRHNWLQLEEQFDVLGRSAKGNTKARAAFYAARSREELGVRSFSATDHRQAVKRFEKVAASWPKNALAPEALYRAAVIAAERLQDGETAQSLAKKLADAYPKSKRNAHVRKVIVALPKATPGKAQTQKTPSGKAREDKKNIAEQLGLTVKTVMLDAGHGGKDPGAEGNGITERNVTLKTARLAGKALEKKGFTVLYTRTRNTYLALNERTELANAKGVDLFISIHVNANTDPSLSGLETYYLDTASNTAAAKVAARENSISVSQVSDLQFILTDLMLDAKTQESRSLAGKVHKGVLGRVKTAKKPVVDHGVRTAPFYVLMGARMPAVLVEIGYLTNTSDAVNLKSDAYLARVADGIAQGVADYRASLAKALP